MAPSWRARPGPPPRRKQDEISIHCIAVPDDPSGLFELDIPKRAYGIDRLRQDRRGWRQRPVSAPGCGSTPLELPSTLDHEVHQSAGDDDFLHDGGRGQEALDLRVSFHNGEQLVALDRKSVV